MPTHAADTEMFTLSSVMFFRKMNYISAWIIFRPLQYQTHLQEQDTHQANGVHLYKLDQTYKQSQHKYQLKGISPKEEVCHEHPKELPSKMHHPHQLPLLYSLLVKQVNLKKFFAITFCTVRTLWKMDRN